MTISANAESSVGAVGSGSAVEVPTAQLPPFTEFASIARLSRDMIVTEKIDGTNAQVHITEDGRVLAGSRSRWITPEADNFGFARWVADHEDELRTGLGVGSHFGEWWGAGIQRRYGLTEKRFSLFNVGRWTSAFNRLGSLPADSFDAVPDTEEAVLATLDAITNTACIEAPCCHVVPVLCRWTFDTGKVDETLVALNRNGSAASPGFMKPEGVVVFHVPSRALFKKTLDKNDGHKGEQINAQKASHAAGKSSAEREPAASLSENPE